MTRLAVSSLFSFPSSSPFPLASTATSGAESLIVLAISNSTTLRRFHPASYRYLPLSYNHRASLGSIFELFWLHLRFAASFLSSFSVCRVDHQSLQITRWVNSAPSRISSSSTFPQSEIRLRDEVNPYSAARLFLDLRTEVSPPFGTRYRLVLLSLPVDE